MQNNHPFGSPFTVLNFSEDLENTTANEQLVKMFEHPEVKSSKIVALSIVGPYRKGKSLFLNYCLRYLYAHYPSIIFPTNPISNLKDWMGMDVEPLVGFSWRSGSNPDTKDIVMWNDVFLHVDKNGEKIGIVVIDTQGLFSSDSSQTDNSRIFALSALISSIQVFNLSGVVQEDQLQYLQFATEYAKFALSDDIGDEKPFQKLFFLIRDWDNPQEFPFGSDGGEKYLQQFFNSKSNKADEFKSLYDYINSLYQDFCCSLLPNPGKIVTQGINKNLNKKYNGSLDGMDEDFKEELAKVIDQILSPEKLIAKRFNGKYLNGAEFSDHMLEYFKFYLTNKAPEVQTVLESIVDKEMMTLLTVCVNKYKEAYRKNQISLLTLDEIQNHHDSCKAGSIILFKESIKIGEPEDELKYQQQLVEQLDSIYHENVKRFEANEKRIKEEKNRIQMELELKHKQELEELRLEMDAQRKKQEMEIQKMKDEYEAKEQSIADEVFKANEQAEKEQKEAELKFKLLEKHTSNSEQYNFNSNQQAQNDQSPYSMDNADSHNSNQHQTISQQVNSYGQDHIVRNNDFINGLSVPTNTSSCVNHLPNKTDRNQSERNNQMSSRQHSPQSASRKQQYDWLPNVKAFVNRHGQQTLIQIMDQYDQQQSSRLDKPNQDNEFEQRRPEQQRILNNHSGQSRNAELRQVYNQPNEMPNVINNSNYQRFDGNGEKSNNNSTAQCSSLERQKGENEREMKENDKRMSDWQFKYFEDLQRETEEKQKKSQKKQIEKEKGSWSIWNFKNKK